MELIFNKLMFISKLNKLTENLAKCESVVNKVKLDYNLNGIDNNSMKMFRISVECNAFDGNEDKQRQCYKQLKCFWPKCRYSAKYQCVLNDHISQHLNKRLRHSSVKRFGCNKCDKRFKTSSDSSRHKKFVHSDYRPFVCPQSDCNKRFQQSHHLKRHLKIHCSDKPFECEECNKRFKDKSYLMSHKLIHSNVKQFICDVNNCKKQFKQRLGLYNHKIRIHSGIKRHKCYHKNCDKSFVTPRELKKHIGYTHSTERQFKFDF